MDGQHVKETKVGVLDKAMAILLSFTSGNEALLPQELAARTGMPLPTIYRLAQALSEHGMLMKDGIRFRLGITLARLGMMAIEGVDVRQKARPHLEWLTAQTEENAELHIRHESSRLVLEVVSSPHNLRPFTDVGTPLPLHQGAAGKVLLAWLPENERTSLIAGSRARFPEGAPFDEQRYEEELSRVRDYGWSFSDGERFSGVSALAAPIWNAGGHIAGAMTLVAPSARLTAEKRKRFVPLVQEAARRTSHDLGSAQ
ncbi:IclR family transcriptional regulator [Thermosporothrix hazakensis]|jgi:IclR family acetate operon transcriptional repressor|uniref:IclR family transcriptional regulator n=3 Tax=Thermosporothrix TaxID=768650 RepID=A0A326U3R9_THEHA|nr:IclR family transcriptional regulator [Thermosporothrix hazakensis]PZW25397.1 IclR family transcriptional regulator [Thermosporothrix hazakensis]BBH90731.1 IclR family transcriptional regulator [Thermosporothrix sp. COM3]GCE48781.1 IclR family transcriptional regulator [Thermosporothrix hazakensis]